VSGAGNGECRHRDGSHLAMDLAAKICRWSCDVDFAAWSVRGNFTARIREGTPPRNDKTSESLSTTSYYAIVFMEAHQGV